MQCLAYLPLIHMLMLFMYFLSLAGHFDSIVLPECFLCSFLLSGFNEVSLFIGFCIGLCGFLNRLFLKKKSIDPGLGRSLKLAF